MPATPIPLCVHLNPDPARCSACRSLAGVMGLLTSSTFDPRRMLSGWYFEQLVEAWGRACGLAGPLYFIQAMRAAALPVPEVRNLSPARA